jgi:hypothetical protein
MGLQIRVEKYKRHFRLRKWRITGLTPRTEWLRGGVAKTIDYASKQQRRAAIQQHPARRDARLRHYRRYD